jgi:hypothetical protein
MKQVFSLLVLGFLILGFFPVGDASFVDFDWLRSTVCTNAEGLDLSRYNDNTKRWEFAPQVLPFRFTFLPVGRCALPSEMRLFCFQNKIV